MNVFFVDVLCEVCFDFFLECFFLCFWIVFVMIFVYELIVAYKFFFVSSACSVVFRVIKIVIFVLCLCLF